MRRPITTQLATASIGVLFAIAGCDCGGVVIVPPEQLDGGAVVDAGEFVDAGIDASCTDCQDAGEPDASDAGGDPYPDGGPVDASELADAGDVDAGEADAGPHLGTAEESAAFAEELLRAWCLTELKCGAHDVKRLVTPDLAVCLQQKRRNAAGLSNARSDRIGSLVDGLTSGRRRVDLDEVPACRAVLESLACDLYFVDLPDPRWPQACQRSARGVVDAGGACHGDADCREGTVCVGGPNWCGATCVALGTGECRTDSECIAGEGCWRPGQEVGKCRRRVEVGDSCRFAPCSAGAFCPGSSEICASYSDVGEPCGTAGSRCLEGLFCESSTQRCVKPEQIRGCPVDEIAVRTSRCVTIETAALACPESCNATSYCDPSVRSCVAKRDSGPCGSKVECTGWCGVDGWCTRFAPEVPCADANECHRSDVAVATCATLPSVGEACLRCVDERTCAEGLFCSGGTCGASRPPPANRSCTGGSCPRGLRCATESLSRLDTGAFHCEPTLREGERCNPMRSQSLSFAECPSTFRCLPGQDGEWRCIRPPSGSAPCGLHLCTADEQCVVDTECVPTSQVPAVGEDCVVEGVLTGICAGNAVCAPTTPSAGRCIERRNAGEPCTEPFACGAVFSTHVCDVGGSNVCVRRPGPGEPCRFIGSYGLCDVEHAWCDEGQDPPVCQAYRAIGEGCDERLECGYLVGLAFCGPIGSDPTRRCIDPYASYVCAP